MAESCTLRLLFDGDEESDPICHLARSIYAEEISGVEGNLWIIGEGRSSTTAAIRDVDR